MEQRGGRPRVLKVFTVVEKPSCPKGIWLEIGVGSYNRDGSISAKLDAMPLNGTIHLRAFESRRGNGSRRPADRAQQNDWNQGGRPR